MYGSRSDSISEFLMYVTSVYRYINPYLKYLYLTLNGCSACSDEKGWRMRGEQMGLVELDVKC